MELPFEKLKREVLLRKDAETSREYGKRPVERSVEELLSSGMICLNKPVGPSSHQVAEFVKQVLGVEKAGHGGTLDPGVNGVLPVALGRATRVSQVLLLAGKEYVCLMHVHKPVTVDEVKMSAEKFLGKISQLPPVRSAVKRQQRMREIYYLEVLEVDGQDVLFKVGCQAGTYIRKLCHDWGRVLGGGAHMAQLVRTKAGPFNDTEWCSMHDVQDAFVAFKENGDDSLLKKVILPVEVGVRHLPKVWVLDSTVDPLAHGANLSVPGIAKLESGIERMQVVAVMTLKDELVCFGRAALSSGEMMKLEKGVAVKPEKVFIDPEVYPHYAKKD